MSYGTNTLDGWHQVGVYTGQAAPVVASNPPLKRQKAENHGSRFDGIPDRNLQGKIPQHCKSWQNQRQEFAQLS